ncbi:GntR family transcriptional regulator [Pseudorhodoferax soli]|uniref:GntR family transcriptional regulator of vanillate catabolism n=1 Tax=Pseudorhodoferax soli TaxID=545864 RepID=A0A368XRW8_9BURK|nr:GntR family transcriptional regulator [Pseudorhodoferax soli]RCW68754.1 GntR family transcriptional regulator of vanillate catabolism [Pseudorhodoferax soli]
MNVYIDPDGREAGDVGGSQSLRAQLRLRELILAGALAPGARIAEVALVERIGVSRTPIRAALLRLEQEGLLQALPGGGYAVRVFSEREVADAIELRGTLEGLSARLAAERGAPAEALAQAGAALDEIDAVLRHSALDDAQWQRYVAANELFHHLLHGMAGSAVVARELERVVRLPFASPSAFVVQQAHAPQARDMLIVAQDQHRQVLDAIARREGARAEAILREHARIAQRNLREAMAAPLPGRAPGVRLVVPEATLPEPAAEATAAPRRRGRPRKDAAVP